MAAGVALLRQQKDSEIEEAAKVPPGERVPATIVLEKIRNAGI